MTDFKGQMTFLYRSVGCRHDRGTNVPRSSSERLRMIQFVNTRWMCLLLVDTCLRWSGSDHVLGQGCDEVAALFLRASTTARIKVPNVVDDLLRSSVEKLCVTFLAELTESLFEGRIQRRVRDERTSNVSISIVVGQGERWFGKQTLTQN